MGSVIEGGGIQGSGFNQGTSRSSNGNGGFAHAGKEQVKQLGGVAKDRVYHQVDSRKGELVKGIQGLVSTLEDASQRDEASAVRPIINGAVSFLRRTSDRLENGTTEELIQDAQAKVRERPGLMMVGCVAVGFALARFIKV